MANSLIQEEIPKELEPLPFDKQKKVFEFGLCQRDGGIDTPLTPLGSIPSRI